MVSEKTIKALNFDKILNAVGELCIAEDSAKMLLSRYPCTSNAQVLREHMQYNAIARTAEEKSTLLKVAAIPSCIDLLNAPQSKIYTREELVILRNALGTMHGCAQWADGILFSDEPSRIQFSSSLIPFSLLKTLQKFFDEQGRIRTENIPELRELERKKLRIQKTRHKVAQEFLRDHDSLCASSTPTLRDDRIVLAIRSSHKSHVAGIVHATSAREKSSYIEIPELYELNNASLQLREEERKHYYKLCLTLSEQVVKLSQKLSSCYEAFMVFDSLYARYQYGRITRGVLVPISSHIEKNTEKTTDRTNYHVHLHKATNPFVIPCSPLTFTFDTDMRQLVLTGPNAGGKTVALKTLGLCALMNQSAIPLPLHTDDASRCILPVFENINVVIGDAQDLEKGVSTFSSHLEQVHNAIKDTHAGASSLLLFDEFCADTDDREGGALACALLEYLAKTNSTVCITTHSALVKHYVITMPHSHACLAALRVRRDEKTSDAHSKPATVAAKSADSYSIIYNAIGTSEAIRVARHVGMPHEVLENYETFLRSFGDDYNSMLIALQNSYAQAEALRTELATQQQEYTQRMQALSAQEKELKRQKQESAHKAYGSGTSLLTSMRKTLERLSEMLAHLKNAPSHAKPLSQDKLTDISHRIRVERDLTKKFQEGVAELERVANDNKEINTYDMRELRKGDEVKILANDAHGTVLSLSQDKKKYRVQAGVLTLTLLRHEIQAIIENSAEDTMPRSGFYNIDTSDLSLTHCLDVRGCTSEEAAEKLEAYIDAAVLQKRKTFSVIHGKGAGILMREIHRIVKAHPLVAHAKYADESDGGVGKTYVHLT